MRLTLLLPALSRLGGAPLSPKTARLLGRGERLPDATPGRQAQLRRYFDLPENKWPLAALTRQDDCGDAERALWLRADPCHIRPDINGARLLAVGDMLVHDDGAKALQPEVQAIFTEAGFDFDMPAPGRWYLKLPEGTGLPDTLPPEDALGLDLIEHVVSGADGRRWRVLLSEVEIALHHHPYNAQRINAGQLPVNSLWLWGGGVLPERIGTKVARFYSNDETALALAACAGVAALLEPLSHLCAREEGATCVFDLTALRSISELDTHWLHPILTTLRPHSLRLDSEDGQQWELRRSHRWRIWRTPWTPPA